MVLGAQTRPQVGIGEQPGMVASLAAQPRVSMNELRVLLREKMLDRQPAGHGGGPPGNFAHPRAHSESAELDDASTVSSQHGAFDPKGSPVRSPIHRGTIDVVYSRGPCGRHERRDAPGHPVRPHQGRMVNKVAGTQSACDPRDTHKPPGQFAYSGMFEEEGFHNMRDYEGVSRPQGSLTHPWSSGENAEATSSQGANHYPDPCQPPGRCTHPRGVLGGIDAAGPQGQFQWPQARRTAARGWGPQGARSHRDLRSPPVRGAWSQEGYAAFETTDRPSAKHRRGANHEPPMVLSHPQINSAIIKAADSRSMSFLVATVETHLPSMNIVNIATSMFRCGKLAADSPRVRVESAATVTKLVAAAQSSLQALPPGDCQTQAISNIAWSLASMQLQEKDLLQLLARMAIANLWSFKHIELSSMLWAFAKLGADKVMPAVTRELFYRAAESFDGALGELSLRTLSTISWALATAKQDPSGLFWALATEIRRKASESTPQEVSNIAWAFGTAGHKDTAMLDALADSAMRQLHKFKAQEISNTLWGFAASMYYHAALFHESILQAEHMQLNPQHLANMLWAFTRVRPRRTTTRQAVALLAPRCTSVMDTMKPQECASALLAVAKAFGQLGRKRAAAPCYAAGPEEGHCPPEVLQFCHAAQHWATRRISSFSAQSLANVIAACAALGLDRLARVAQTEVMQRSLKLPPSGLVALLRGLLSNLAIPIAAACPVANSLAHNFPSSPGDVSSLSRLFLSRHPERSEEPSRAELLEWCVQLSLDASAACARAAAAGAEAHPEGEDCGSPRSDGGAEPAVHRVKNTFIECLDEEIADMRTKANFFCSAPPVVRKEERVTI